MSKFLIKLIWFIVLTMAVIVSFNLQYKDGYKVRDLIIFARVFSTILLFIWTVGMGETLKEIVTLRYKLIENGWDYEVKYLIIGWFFIPSWKPINEKYHSYTSQNMFGAETHGGYSTDVTYKSKGKALKAIEEHKLEIKKARVKWFKKPEPKKRKITYL